MAYSQKDVDRIDRAIATGQLEVEYADRKVRYRSVRELREAKSEIVKELEANAPRSRIIRLRHGGKGLL